MKPEREINFTVTILFQTFQNSPKIQKYFERRNKHMPLWLYPTDEFCIISKRLYEIPRGRFIPQLQNIIPLFENFQKFAKNDPIVK